MFSIIIIYYIIIILIIVIIHGKAHDIIGHRIDPSWRTHWAIPVSS